VGRGEVMKRREGETIRPRRESTAAGILLLERRKEREGRHSLKEPRGSRRKSIK
jgi:hypothetical protein